MKSRIKYLLQSTLGFSTYLYVFALFKIRTLKRDNKERDFFYFLQMVEDRKGLVLDIGANLGIMSYHLARKLPNTTIHAFEPIPANFKVLNQIKNRFHLNNIQLHQLALGENSGKVLMILPCDSGALLQGLSHVKHDSIHDFNEGIEIEVDIDRLDNVLNGELVQAIKLDVENFEYFVLRGGERIIQNNHPIIYAELWDNENRSQCFDFLKQFNYQAFVVQDNKLTPFQTGIHSQQNFIFKVG